MRNIKTILILASVMFCCQKYALAQEVSEMSIKYMLSFDSTKNVYIAWIVPSYSTPNMYNPDTEEKGVTAQFTIKVPTGGVISDIKSLKGDWEASPTKISNSDLIKGLDKDYEYYVIGKAPNETNYGGFSENEPIALFTFKTKNMDVVRKPMVVENRDKAIKVLMENYSLNIASSFYSRSGQRATVSAKPLEQFRSEISLIDIFNENIKKLNEQYSLGFGEISFNTKLVAYPNPSSEILNFKILVTDSGEFLKLDLFDYKGNLVKSQTLDSKLGYNSGKFDISGLTPGSYILKSQVGKKVLSSKIVKQ